jgi:hypothetical protein
VAGALADAGAGAASRPCASRSASGYSLGSSRTKTPTPWQRLGDLLDAENLHGAVDDGFGDLVVCDEFAAAGQARARLKLAGADALLEVVGDLFVSIAGWHGVISSVELVFDPRCVGS